MAKIPSIPPRSLKPLGSRKGGPTSEPMALMLLGLLSGSVSTLFFKRMIPATAISRMTFKYSPDVSVVVLGIVQRVPRNKVCLQVSGVLTKEVSPGENSARAQAQVSKGKHRHDTQNTYHTSISSRRTSGMVLLLAYAVKFPSKMNCRFLLGHH